MLKDEQATLLKQVAALSRISEIYPDAEKVDGRVVAPSMRVHDAEWLCLTEDRGHPSFFTYRKIDGVDVCELTVHLSPVLRHLREHNPDALEAAVRSVSVESTKAARR